MKKKKYLREFAPQVLAATPGLMGHKGLWEEDTMKLCPFKPAMPMAITVGGNFITNEKPQMILHQQQCGTHCPLFQLSEDNLAKLHCTATPQEYFISEEEPDNTPPPLKLA